MIKWLISLMMVCSLSVTVSACKPDDSLKNTENTVPEPEPNPDPTPEPVTGNGMFDLSKGENGNPPSIRLSSGYDMPIIGLGTYSLHGKVCVNAILSAVKHGYRNSTRRVSTEMKKRSARPSAPAACRARNCSSAQNSTRTSLPMRKKPLKNHCANSILVMWI